MDETDRITGVFIDEEEEVQAQEGEEGSRSRVFAQLKPYCVELLELVENPKKHTPVIPAMLQFLGSSPSSALQHFFDYILFPLLLLLDASIDCRSPQKVDTEEKFVMPDFQKMPRKVSDYVAEGVLQCLEELLKKCHFRSVNQMVVVLKKLTYGALLPLSEASEEFREGVIKCFRALLLSLLPCSDKSCSCKQILGLPTLLESGSVETSLCTSTKNYSESEECLLAFLQSQTASTAVGHWLSLLLQAADTEAARGHRGSAKLRIEAFTTLRVLVAKVGSADALAFFLPGVVSKFAKVLHASKTMISGAGGSAEAINQAIRGFAEYLMIVLQDDANISSLDVSIDFVTDFNSSKHKSTQSFLEELRSLPDKAQEKIKIVAEDSSAEALKLGAPKAGVKEERSTIFGEGIGSLHVNRTKDWIEETSAHVNKLLAATFPHICVHPAKKVRQGLLAAIQGLLSKCIHTLKESRLMLLECLCVLVGDDSDEVSMAAQQFLNYLFSLSGKNYLERDVVEIFRRLIEKLPKMVLGREESLAISHAQQLLVVIYFSGPQLVVDHLLRSPVAAARFLDVFAVCLSQNSLFAGSLDKLLSTRQSSVGYLPSVSELKAGTDFTSNYLTLVSEAPSENSMRMVNREKAVDYPLENLQKNFELPRMPPWFVYVGSPKLYQALSGILRLVGLSSIADLRSEGHLSIIADIPLVYLRKLISEIRVKEYNNESWQSWYNRTGSGQVLRQASTAVCILNEMIFGLSDQAVDIFTRMFQKSGAKREEAQELDAGLANGQHYKVECSLPNETVWRSSQDKGVRSQLIDCVGRILHEYLSPEVWDLPVEHKSSLIHPDDEAEDISLHFFRDTAMLHQVIIDGIGIFNICLGRDFAFNGFLHSSLYLLLENLVSSNFEVRSAADVILHVLSATSGYETVGHLVLGNADYVIDSVCRQLRHLDLNPHVPNVLAAMLSYIGVARKILPLLEEPIRSVSLELEILSRSQHPDLTVPFLKAVAEIAKASKHEASLHIFPSSLPSFLPSLYIYIYIYKGIHLYFLIKRTNPNFPSFQEKSTSLLHGFAFAFAFLWIQRFSSLLRRLRGGISLHASISVPVNLGLPLFSPPEVQSLSLSNRLLLSSDLLHFASKRLLIFTLTPTTFAFLVPLRSKHIIIQPHSSFSLLMAELAKFCLALLLAFSLLGFSVPQQSPYTSPSPAPELGADSSPPPPLVPVASPASPPSTSSPPALSPEDLPPGSPPTPSPSPSTSTHPGPAPSAVSDLGHVSADGGVHEGNGSSEGMSGAKKGGIAIGVILAAGLVVVGGFVYKKRRDNIRRTQYGYAARREIL